MSIRTQLILAGILVTIGIFSHIFFAGVSYGKSQNENICSKCKLEMKAEKESVTHD